MRGRQGVKKEKCTREKETGSGSLHHSQLLRLMPEGIEQRESERAECDCFLAFSLPLTKRARESEKVLRNILVFLNGWFPITDGLSAKKKKVLTRRKKK